MSYAITFQTTSGRQQFKNNYKQYLQLFGLCVNMCNYNLMVITTNGSMEWMFSIMWTYIQFYIHSSGKCKIVKMINQQQ
jgi:hypothetical protein